MDTELICTIGFYSLIKQVIYKENYLKICYAQNLIF